MFIHQNPSYYAGCRLEVIEGTMDHLGFVTAEQNHYVNVAIIGKGSLISIVEQVSALISRNQYTANNQRKTRDQLYVSTVSYKSDHGGTKDQMMFMPKYMFLIMLTRSYFVKATKKLYLQHRYKPNGKFISWPIGQAFNLEDSILM